MLKRKTPPPSIVEVVRNVSKTITQSLISRRKLDTTSKGTLHSGSQKNSIVPVEESMTGEERMAKAESGQAVQLEGVVDDNNGAAAVMTSNKALDVDALEETKPQGGCVGRTKGVGTFLWELIRE